MTRAAILAAVAGIALACAASPGLAQDDAKATGDTSLSGQAIQSGDIPVQGADAHAAPRLGGAVCPPMPRPHGYPRGAHPGQCFARVRTAPTYQSYVERVLVTPARHERRLVPAVYDWAERQVLAEPARVERRVIPATYRSVTETEVATPATVRVERIDPIYDTVSDQVMTRPAHTEWRRTFVGPDGLPPPDARVEATGEVVCLVEVPAEYKTVQRQVLKAPGRTVETPIPAVTRTVTRQVIDQPEQVAEIQVPAVYRTERYRRLVTPAHCECTEIPAVYATRIRQRMVSPGRLEWRLSNCAAPGAKSLPGAGR
jgi:hypothetical protein